ncbi:MAG TPA: ribosome recycling factor [Alphaproteobacteria bacterium]|nr:ribosome recycling factor [Alphaproteobacteria bacterium]
MSTKDLDDVKRRMDGAIDALKREFAGLRTGRASTGLLDQVRVEAYGQQMPLSQVGTVGVPEPRLLTVQVWDKSMVGAVERAIRDSDLGLNPSTDGQLVRVPIPELSEERRKELSKVANRYAEQAKVAVRNVRRDGMDMLKTMEKEGEISKDEHKSMADRIQKLTDEHVKDIDAMTDAKEKEIMQV